MVYSWKRELKFISWMPVRRYTSARGNLVAKYCSIMPTVWGSRYASGLRRGCPSSPMHTKSHPQVSIPILLMAMPRVATAFSPLIISL